MSQRSEYLYLTQSTLFAIFLFATLVYPADIRVKIAESKELTISCTGYFEIADQYGTFGLRYASPLVVKIEGNRILIEKYGRLSDSVTIYPLLSSHILTNGRRYRGRIELLPRRDTIFAINIVDIEEYLYGVIKQEISPFWPIDAVKAQAVIARTFVHNKLKRHIEEGFDLCSGVHCQVYGGLESEEEPSIVAVNETEGEVLYYGEALAEVYYHATCGGRTADISDVWGGRIPYLKEKTCRFCSTSPHYNWKAVIECSEIEKVLRIARIHSIKKIGHSRARELIILYKGGKKRISANRFRMVFGVNRIKSTLFRMKREGDLIRFTGKGWGHGVGLCQWGAKGMAEKGFTYREILLFYFPGCKIVNQRS